MFVFTCQFRVNPSPPTPFQNASPIRIASKDTSSPGNQPKGSIYTTNSKNCNTGNFGIWRSRINNKANANETEGLKRQLAEEQEKVKYLTSQLATNVSIQ